MKAGTALFAWLRDLTRRERPSIMEGSQRDDSEAALGARFGGNKVTIGARVAAHGSGLGTALALLPLCAVYAYAGNGVMGEESHPAPAHGPEVAAWRRAIDREHALIAENRRSIAAATSILEKRVADAQAKIVELDATTTALMGTAGIDAEALAARAAKDSATAAGSDERVDADDASSGREAASTDKDRREQSAAKLGSILDGALGELDRREEQLELLDDLLLRYKTEPRGMPVHGAWISSSYGERIDPITGHRRKHNGVDIAGRAGSNVVAVADGLVTWSGPRVGYGQTIEVTHRQGLVTRYAHNQGNLVEVGDLVHRGQVIAHLGATGRITGPNLHYEVLRGQRPVDPAQYMK